MMIHLPIGFLLLAIVFDVASYSKNYEYLRRAVPFTLMTGFASAAVACVLGFMLSLKGDYDGQTLSNHKLSGISLTLMAGVLYVMTTSLFKRMISLSRRVFSCLCVSTLLLLSYAGHQGANLTHGNNYITLETLLHKDPGKPASVDEAMIFEDVVHPILEKRCMQCHQSSKKKGRLSMESLAGLLKGGKTGPSVVPGNLHESELFTRITLDPSHEDFMPTDGKPPLTKAETEILIWWIESGMAVKEKRLSELKNHQKIKPLVASYLGFGEPSVTDVKLFTAQKVNAEIPDTLDIRSVENLRKKGLVVRVMLKRPVMLDVTLPPRSGRKMSEIVNDLKPVAGNIIWLNLSDNGLTENDLQILRQMSNLEKLRLEKNPVSDGLSNHLKDLKYLEALNLNETKISPKGLHKLQSNPALQRIYTWRTLCDSLN